MTNGHDRRSEQCNTLKDRCIGTLRIRYTYMSRGNEMPALQPFSLKSPPQYRHSSPSFTYLYNCTLHPSREGESKHSFFPISIPFIPKERTVTMDSANSNLQNDTGAGQTPIAVVGLSGKFSGEASSPRKLWDLVLEGKSTLGEVPESRYNPKGFHHPNGERAGTSNTNKGYFIQEDVRRFDAAFFSITPTEAAGMDPTQRLLLELAYESIENGELSLELMIPAKAHHD